jgi:hypothetical protein
MRTYRDRIPRHQIGILLRPQSWSLCACGYRVAILRRPRHEGSHGSPRGIPKGRTGTAGDEVGALWLAHEAARLGVEVTTEVFKLDRLEPVACYLELDGERIPAVPAFDAPGTGADGVTGALSLSEHDEAILVMRLSPRSVYTGEYKRLRRDCASRLVIACSGGTSGMGLLPRQGKIPHVGRQQSAVPSAGRPLAARNRYGRGNRHRCSGCRFSRQAGHDDG